MNTHPTLIDSKKKPKKIQNENGQVKFDFRYHVIVRSYRPLEAYVMKRFWPKLASEEYDLDVSPSQFYRKIIL